MKNVTFRQLRVFVEAARVLSFARAAENLNLTPPAVSLQVKELEKSVGLPLFDRAGRQVALTTVGEYFLVYARRILATLKEADDAMAGFSGLSSGSLSVGIVNTASHFIPDLMQRFHQEHNAIDIRLRVAHNRQQMHDLLGSGEIDLAVMGRPPSDLTTRGESFAAHPFVFICAPEHALLQVGNPPLSTVQRYPLIVREQGSGTRAAMSDFFIDQNCTPSIGMELSSNDTIKQAVAANMGVGFLSLHSLGYELQSGAISIVHVAETPVMRVWNIIRLASRTLSPAAEAFRYFVLEHAEDMLAERDAIALA